MGIQDEKAWGPAGSGRRVAWPFQSLDTPRLQACPQSQAGFAAPPLVRTCGPSILRVLQTQSSVHRLKQKVSPAAGLCSRSGGDSSSGTGWRSPGVVVRGRKPPIESRGPNCKMAGVRQLQLRWNVT